MISKEFSKAWKIDKEEAEKHPCPRCGGRCRYGEEATGPGPYDFAPLSVCTECGKVCAI